MLCRNYSLQFLSSFQCLFTEKRLRYLNRTFVIIALGNLNFYDDYITRYGDNLICCSDNSYHCCQNWNCHHNHPGSLRLLTHVLLRQRNHFISVVMIEDNLWMNSEKCFTVNFQACFFYVWSFTMHHRPKRSELQGTLTALRRGSMTLIRKRKGWISWEHERGRKCSLFDTGGDNEFDGEPTCATYVKALIFWFSFVSHVRQVRNARLTTTAISFSYL